MEGAREGAREGGSEGGGREGVREGGEGKKEKSKIAGIKSKNKISSHENKLHVIFKP